MVEDKRLGKITYAAFGFGGYQDAMIGLSIQVEADGASAGDFFGAFPDTSQTTREMLGHAVIKLHALLKAAKKKEVHDLVGVPVEVIWQGNLLKSWRILIEVL